MANFMNRYNDEDKILNEEELKQLPWCKFKIFAATEADKKELLEAFRHFHNSRDIDTDFITVNQLVHLYLDEPENSSRIEVRQDLFV